MTSTEPSAPFRVLFVCTGNTCRSPTAEALARRELDARGWEGIEVSSAGVATAPGTPASEGALRAAARQGLDLSGHGSRLLTAERVASADVILTMSASHAARVRELGGGDRVWKLTAFARGDAGGSGEGGEVSEETGDSAGAEDGAAGVAPDVPDPFGGDDARYDRTFAALDELVSESIRRLEPMVEP